MAANTAAPGRGGSQAQPPEPTEAISVFTEAALERHKREGMLLAVRARWVALAIIAAMLPFLNPRFEVIYYEILLIGFALIGWAQLRVARVGVSLAEILLIFADIALMTTAIIVPNPLAPIDWPLEVQFRFGAFDYLYVFLAAGTLAYSWRTIRGIGNMTFMIWSLGVGIVWLLSGGYEPLTEAVQAALSPDMRLAEVLDPNDPQFMLRVQEVVIFLIVANMLALTVRRYGDLVMGHAALERERANLARYFSPNVVESLSQNDEPLKEIRTQNVAVLFVDIVGFTRYAADRTPQEVIDTLRQFHQRMGDEVFRHNGTLDKYLGDGLMATFGTPLASDTDALNALRCARAMVDSMTSWNAERTERGEPAIHAGFGLHYGPAVLGDIGSSRLEFAVIGNTVNIASRVESLTRQLSVELAATDDLMAAARHQANGSGEVLDGFVRQESQEIRGLDTKMAVWSYAAPDPRPA